MRIKRACSWGIVLAVSCLMNSVTVASDGSAVSESSTNLYSGFVLPPRDSRPRTWWHWIDDCVTKEGITKDLQAMSRIGLKGAHITNISGGKPEEEMGNACVLSPYWLEMVQHAAKECERLGLELGMSSASGCSGSGGPWIPPELSMQEIVWSQKHITGGGLKTIALPQPPTKQHYYRDVAVLAFPTLPGDAVPLLSLSPKITSSVAGLDWSPAIDGDPKTFVTIPRSAKGQTGVEVTFEFPKPLTVRSLDLHFLEDGRDRSVTLSISGDGKQWGQLVNGRRWRSAFESSKEELIDGFPEQRTRFVKLNFPANSPSVPLTIYELNFQSTRLQRIHTKAARQRSRPDTSDPSSQNVLPAQVIVPDQILDLTASLIPGGVLQAKLPEGEWTILRFGHTSNGNKIKPVPKRSTGLEVDKFSAEALKYHFENGMLGETCKRLGPLVGKTFLHINLDSWEAGCQTWTGKFPEEFSTRRGYELRKWLPTLTGRIVGSVDLTERFLWDYRRTIADVLNENYYGAFRELCSARGILLEGEAPGIGMPCVTDELQSLGMIDIPQGEFWLGGTHRPGDPAWCVGGQDNTKEAAVAAHVYGKPIVSCEAFTSFAKDDGWTQYPFRLKPVGDRQFCKGMNEIVFHRYVHQPDDRVPGMSLGQFGLNFERTLTWWEQGRAWITYLSRCQYLLRQGRFHADVCYYYGEDVPGSAWYFVPNNVLDPRKRMKPVLPAGYDYDVCDNATFLQMSVEDNHVVLPSGMRYRYLVVPEHARYTPRALRKVQTLIQAGATVIGPRPGRCPSLADYPRADDAVEKLASQLWPTEEKPAQRSIGRGRVISGKPFETIFAEDQFPADFQAAAASEDAEIRYIHRKLPSAELYFVSNQKDRSEDLVLQFRVTGQLPEVWDPATGQRADCAVYHDNGVTTSVSARTEPYESLFFLFERPSDGTVAVRELKRNGAVLQAVSGPQATNAAHNPRLTLKKDKLSVLAWESGEFEATLADGKTVQANVASLPDSQIIAGPWNVTFQKGRGTPERPIPFDELSSWTKRPEDGIKYFSGTATYQKAVNISEERLASNRRVYLDLGKVKHVAEVFVNGTCLGVVWKKPFRVDITRAAKPGANDVRVRVTNVWRNRLIGDAALPVEQRLTWTVYPFYKPDEPLEESGLLGPVHLLSAQSVRFQQSE